MKRRLVLFLALLLSVLPVTAYGKAEKPALRVGILSDVHVRKHKEDSIFVKALEYFKGRDVDAVMLVGDFTCDGTEDQMANIAKDWFMVFPNDKGRKGKKVERVFVYGNHEMEGTTYKEAITHYSREYLDSHAIVDHKAEYWEKYWHEPFSPFYQKEIKGYTFIGAQYVDKYTSPGEIPGMKEYFDRIGPTLPKDKPIFYIQHKHPRWTVPWAADNGQSTRILKNYPNLICFSGHCHSSLTDEMSIWQGKFTSVNTSSLSKANTHNNHENSKQSAKNPDHTPQMQMMSLRNAHHGMLMEVFSDRVVLHRYDFHYDEELGIWTIPNDVSQRPYDYKLRKAEGAKNPPCFNSSATVRTKRALGKDRNKQPSEQVQVFFPVAVSHGKSPRALDYEIQVEKQEADSVRVIATRLVYSPNFFHSEQHDSEKTARCHFAVSDLPAGVPIRFAVYPRDSFQNKGGSIYSKFIEL